MSFKILSLIKLINFLNLNIINKNMLYKEGILEILENNFEINFIIINEKINLVKKLLKNLMLEAQMKDMH